MKCFLLLLCLPITNVFAQSQSNQSQYNTTGKTIQQNTPVEAFIRHIKEANQFVQVSNIWQADNNFDQTELLQKVEKAQPLTIDYSAVADLIRKNTTAISLVVPGINGGTYTIDLAQYNPLSNDFRVNAKAGDVETPFNYTPGKYYSGVVNGIPGSVAAFSFFKNEVYGIFSIPGLGNLVLVPNAMVGASYDYNQHYILYNDFDLKIKDQAPKCSTDKLNTDNLDITTFNKTTTTLNNNVYMSCKEVNVMELGDYAYFVTKGSLMATAVNYLTALFNNQAVIYRNESVIINLKYLQINTASDVYQTLPNSSTAFLNAFGDDIQNTYKTVRGCNVALLATTRYGSMGGVAWLQAMCANYSAGSHYDGTGITNIDNGGVAAFPTYSWNVEVLTHEMGHIVGSSHTHACLWNPPYTGSTAIDGCYTLEGSCATPVPALPPGGGTIMSYCHLTAVGINFSNGFGPQPGTVIRDYISSTAPPGNPNAPAGCVPNYNPTVALSTANRTISANRECTDLTTNITYYWKDNNTADQSDDTLVLMVKKNGNNIGDLNTVGFSVTANTIVRYGSGTGDTISFPSGTSASIMAQNYSMRRYWKITPTATPATAVEVMFPFLSTDTTDVHGSVLSGPAPLSSYLIYKTNGGIDPNPANGFPGATAASFSIYTYSTTPTATNWSLSTVGATKLAHMMMTNLAGGGSAFYTYCTPHPAPTPGAIPAAQCPGATVVYSVTPDPSAISYNWTVSGTGWSGSSTTNSITLTVGSGVGTISVKATDSCGPGTTYTFPPFTPLPLPVEIISSTTSLCVGATTAGFSAAVTTGGPVLPTDYSWSVSGTGWSVSGPNNTSTLTVNVGTGIGTIVVHATNACGVGPDATFNAVLSATTPPAPTSITPPGLVCPSTIGVFTTPVIPGATFYTWTVSGTGWNPAPPSSSTSINVMIGTGTGTVTVSASNGCGTSAVYSRNITPSSGPGAATSISGPATPCSGTNVTLTTPVIPTASSYSWVVSGSGWGGSSSTNSINVTVGTGTGTITVTPINTCGAGGSYTTTIAASSAPGSSFALSTHIVPIHTNIIAFYTGSAPAGSTFTWSFPGGVGSPGTGSGAQTVYWNTPGQYLIFLTVGNGAGCSSAYADTVDVTAPLGLQNLNIQKIDAGIVPNPNNGTFDILFTDPVNQPVSVKLFDMQGRIVYTNDFSNALSKKLAIETNNLPPGTYTVTIYVNESAISKKITVLK